MHLADDSLEAKPVEWMQRPAWKKAGRSGEVVLLDEPIDGGAVIGRVGNAGPAELAKSQIHFEIFSTGELFTHMPASPWKLIDGTAGGRFCDSPEIDEAIDSNKDGILDKQELAQFYSTGGGSALRYFVTLHVSEWTEEPSWAESLRVPKDFRKWKPADIDALVAEQITPGLWWDARVAAHARLPIDGFVYHYHPITFVSWFNQQLIDAKASAGKDTIDPSKAREAKSVGLQDDLGDVTGSSMRSAAEVTEDPCNNKLTLAELVQGFDAPECAP
jgi:hypothetical protein